MHFTCATLPVFFRWFWSSLVAPSWNVLGRAASSIVNSGVLSWNSEISTDWAACNTQNTSLLVTKSFATIYPVFPAFVCISKSTRLAFLSTRLRNVCAINCFYNKLSAPFWRQSSWVQLSRWWCGRRPTASHWSSQSLELPSVTSASQYTSELPPSPATQKHL